MGLTGYNLYIANSTYHIVNRTTHILNSTKRIVNTTQSIETCVCNRKVIYKCKPKLPQHTHWASTYPLLTLDTSLLKTPIFLLALFTFLPAYLTDTLPIVSWRNSDLFRNKDNFLAQILSE